MEVNPHHVRISKPAADLDQLSFTEATLLAEWVATLPIANTAQTAIWLTTATEEIARLRTGFSERLAMLEAVRPTLEYICTRLDRTASTSRDSNVAHTAQHLQANLALGYKTVVVEAAEAGDEQRVAQKESLPLAIHRAISELARILLRTLQQYIPPTRHLWLELHQLYAFAEHLELLEETTADVTNQSDRASSIADAYLRAVLLAAAKPNQLRHHQLTQVFNALELWTPRARIDRTLGDALFLVDLEADRGPLYSKLAGDCANPRSVYTDVLAFEIEAYLKDIATEIPVPDYVTRDVLRHVMAAWGRVRPRAYHRTGAQGTLMVCTGLRNSHYYLSGGVEFADQLASTDALLRREINPFLEPRAARSSPPDVWHEGGRGRIPENPNIPEPERILLQRRREAATNYPLFDTSIVDISPGGYCIEWDGELPKNLQTGELLAIREATDSRWCIAVLRWIRQDIARPVAGMQLIAPRAIPVAIRIVQKKGGPTDYARAFLLPEIKPVNQPPTIVTPNVPFQAGHKVHVQRQGIQTTAQLLNNLMSTQSFNQFTFRMLGGYLENAQIDLNVTSLSQIVGSDEEAPAPPGDEEQR